MAGLDLTLVLTLYFLTQQLLHNHTCHCFEFDLKAPPKPEFDKGIHREATAGLLYFLKKDNMIECICSIKEKNLV